MEIIIGVIIGVVAMLGVSSARKKRAGHPEPERQRPEAAANVHALQHKRTVEPPTHHELFRLQLQDVISCLGTDYIIEGRIDMEEDGEVWTSYMLVDGSDVVWLCVEDDDEIETSLWTEVEDCPIPQEVPDIVEYQAKRFQLVERGTAKASQMGETGQKSGKKVRYFDYDCPGVEDRLAVEIWRGAIEVYTGHAITPGTLQIFPHDGREL